MYFHASTKGLRACGTGFVLGQARGLVAVLNPDHIADQYWMLHCQPRDAWTHELDLRPWMEKF